MDSNQTKMIEPFFCPIANLFLKRKHTPQKTNMEPQKSLFEKENHLPNPIFGFHVNFPGCVPSNLP